jgi:hypothetical protein
VRVREEGVGAGVTRCSTGDEMEGVKSNGGARAGVEERTARAATVAGREKGRRERERGMRKS